MGDLLTRFTESDIRRLVKGPLPKAVRVAKIPKVNEGEELFANQLESFRLPKFQREYLFAESMGRRFRADFANVEYKLLCEINGGIWLKGGGAHSRPSKIEGDIERLQYAALLGFTVLPFTPDQVYSGYAIDWTERTLRARGWLRWYRGWKQ